MPHPAESEEVIFLQQKVEKGVAESRLMFISQKVENNPFQRKKQKRKAHFWIGMVHVQVWQNETLKAHFVKVLDPTFLLTKSLNLMKSNNIKTCVQGVELKKMTRNK